MPFKNLEASAKRGLKLVLEALATHLLSSASSKAYYISPSTTFDPQKLYGLLLDRLSRARKSRAFASNNYIYFRRTATDTTEEDEEQALAKLSNLSILTALDFIGLNECLSEVGDNLNASSANGNTKETKPAMLVIDPLSPPINAIFAHSIPTDAHALLVPFFRHLAALTYSHDLLTMLVYLAVGVGSKTTPGMGGQYRTREEDVSIFASVRGYPGLGRTVSEFFDLTLFVSWPEEWDAEGRQLGERRGGKAESKRVVEVLKDRKGGREGRWGVW